MTENETLKTATALIPHRYQKKVITLLSAHFTPEMMAEAITYLEALEEPPLGPEEITELVFKLVGEITGIENIAATTSRRFHEVLSRQMVMLTLYLEVPGATFDLVGKLFEHKFDHASVMHAKKSMEIRYSCDSKTRDKLNELAKYLTEKNLNGLAHFLPQIDILA
jgi:chromosomal replication initiation ATPase DnaA